jgi:hypothetical protein
MADSDRHVGAETQRRRGFSVAPSPLNAVKFDLGVILVLGIFLLLVHAKLVSGVGAQLLLLVAYGLASMVWLVVRTRRVLRAARAAND